MSSPCSSCTKRCCSNYTVSITGYDAWVIGTGLRLPLHSFLVYFPLDGDTGRGFRLAPDGPGHDIALDKVGKYQKGNPCVFWVDLNGGRGRCGIYTYRPFVCQTYPAYQQENDVLLRDDVLCPPGSWNLTAMDLALFRGRLHRFRVEQDVYAYVVSRWNWLVQKDGARSIHAYYTFVMNTYDALDRLRRSLPEQRLAAAVDTWGRLDSRQPNPLRADTAPAAAHEALAPLLDGIHETVERLTAAPAVAGDLVAV